jgi:TolB-like protein/Flp pilus assembly protein TadD
MQAAASPGDGRQNHNDGRPPAISAVPPEAIQAQLQKVLSSATFARAERLSRFLRFAVEQALAGHGDKLKEYVVGVEVFQRQQDFDPRIDAVVRVEARRLRFHLKKYYEGEGRDDPVWIDFPKGAYVPVFEARRPAAGRRPWWPGGKAPRLGLKQFVVLAVLLLAAAGGWLVLTARRARWTSPQGPANAGRVSSILILPFSDLSPQHDQEYFCDGMTDELISALTKVEGLRVLSQASAFQFKGKAEDLGRIAEQFQVGAVLRGSVRREDNRLRVTAQLIRASDGAYLWSETFERAMQDLFAIQDEISRTVVQKLQVQLAEEKRRLVRPYTGNTEAHNLYLQGRHYWNQRTEDGLNKSIELFERAVALDPKFALAYAALADSRALLASYGLSPPRQIMPKAKEAVVQALAMDETLGEAHASLGFVRFLYEWDWAGAEQAYKRAFELNPGYAIVHHWYAGYLRAMGRLDEALAEARQAQALDPLSPAIGRDLGRILLCQRHYDQAIEQYRKTLDLEPGFPSGYLHLGMAYAQKAMYPEAVAACQKARELRGANPLTLAGLGYCYGRWGQRDKAQELLAELKRASGQRYVSAFDLALIYVGLDQKDPAFEWLDRAREDRDGWLVWLNVDPVFDSLRSDPRFAALAKRVGLPEASRGRQPSGSSD